MTRKRNKKSTPFYLQPLYGNGGAIFFALWKKWTRWEGESDTADYAVLDQLPGYDDEIYGKVLDLIETLPGSLLQEAAEALGEELVEFVE